jgi:hypothetical protein
MKKSITVLSAMALSLGLLAGPAFASLPDTGPKGDLEDACEDLGGEFEANGWGKSGDPTCVVDDAEVQENGQGTIITTGGTTTYVHESTTTGERSDSNLVTGGSWDEGTTEGGGMCILVQKTGKEICPAGRNK